MGGNIPTTSTFRGFYIFSLETLNFVCFVRFHKIKIVTYQDNFLSELLIKKKKLNETEKSIVKVSHPVHKQTTLTKAQTQSK